MIKRHWYHIFTISCVVCRSDSLISKTGSLRVSPHELRTPFQGRHGRRVSGVCSWFHKVPRKSSFSLSIETLNTETFFFGDKSMRRRWGQHKSNPVAPPGFRLTRWIMKLISLFGYPHMSCLGSGDRISVCLDVCTKPSACPLPSKSRSWAWLLRNENGIYLFRAGSRNVVY